MRNELLIAATVAALGCGGGNAETKQPKPASTDSTSSDTTTEGSDSDAGAAASADNGGGPKKDPCSAFDGDLGTLLMQAACEVPNPAPDAKSVDMKGKLAVSLVAADSTVSPGSKVDLILTLANKSNAPIPLYFTLDPTPRFPTETYDKKARRVDMPSANPPKLPNGVPPREATSHETARITIVPNGTVKLTVPWSAVRMRWAPEKLRGTPPEEGYPRVPAGNLPRGKYTVKVAMPLVLVFEGMDREVSAPKTVITVK